MRLVLEITFDDDDYYAKADHEAASKFIGQKLFREFGIGGAYYAGPRSASEII